MSTNSTVYHSPEEQKLHEELDRYLSAVSCGIIQYTRYTHKILYVNDLALKILGYSSIEEMQNDSFNGVVHTVYPDDAENINNLVASLNNENEFVEYEYRVKLKDGTRHICYGSARLIEREGQEPIIIRSILDITKSHEVFQRSMETLMHTFQLLYSTSGDFAYIFDIKNGIARFSEQQSKVWGVPSELPGIPYDFPKYGIVAKNSVPTYLRVHEDIMNGKDSSHGILEINGPDGQTMYADLCIQAMTDENGNHTGKAIGIFKDITDSTYKDIKQSMIIKTLSDIYSSVYYINVQDSMYERIKEREASVHEIPPSGEWTKGLTGYFTLFVDPKYHDKFKKFTDKQFVLDHFVRGRRFTFEYRRIDGGWRRAFFAPVKFQEDGKVKTFLFAVQQIETEKQRELETQRALHDAYQAVQEASNAKSTFLSNMSHDIRTPMNAIIGMTTIAQAHLNDPEKIADCLKKIEASGQHLMGLINQVLDMSKIESGKIDLTEEKFNLSDTLMGIVAMNQTMCDSKNHDLIVNINSFTHSNVIGDRTRLEQVINNILSNAVKYTPDGGRIEVTLTEKETNKPDIGLYEIVVKDNGIGMTKEYQKNVFEPFSRANDQRTASIQGTGLGMAIARNIIRMMGGDITLESEVNVGSTFTLSFALTLQKEEKNRHKDFIGLHCLVADYNEVDCADACGVLSNLLIDTGYASSGKYAIQKTVSHHERGNDYFAVLVDKEIRDLKPAEVIQQLHEKLGDAAPIMILTSRNHSTIEQDAKKANADAFLRQPITKKDVEKLFSELIADKKKAEEERRTEEEALAGKRILLTDDVEINREIAAELLAMYGASVELAENGSVCVDMFNDHEAGYYDLILMDIQMPIMNGYDATRAIRDLPREDAKTIPIVAMTAYAFSADVRAAFDAGMNGHISKPIDIQNVINVITEILN